MFSQWIRDNFLFKERLLTEFYNNESQPPAILKPDEVTAENISPDHDSASATVWPPQLAVKPNLHRPLLLVLSWIALTVAGLVYLSWFRWVCTCVIVVCVGSRAAVGFDSIELALHSDMVAEERNRASQRRAKID